MLYVCTRVHFSAKKEKAGKGDERIGLDFRSYCVRPCARPFKCMISFFVHGTEKCHVCFESPGPRVPHSELSA